MSAVFKVSPDALSARAVSLFEPGRNCMAVVEAKRAAILVDGEDYFRAFRAACLRARESIVILGWDFNSQTCLDFDKCEDGTQVAPPLLGDFLNYLAKRRSPRRCSPISLRPRSTIRAASTGGSWRQCCWCSSRSCSARGAG